MLRQGQTRDAVITHSRVRWNLDADDAERLVERAERGLGDEGATPVTPTRGSNVPDFLETNRLPLIISGVLLGFIALFVIGIFLAVPSEESEESSEAAVLSWTEEPVIEGGFDTYRFKGRITNETVGWAAVDPTLVLRLLNPSGLIVSERRVDLIVSRVGPGESRPYSIDVQLLEDFDTFSTELEWDWVRVAAPILR